MDISQHIREVEQVRDRLNDILKMMRGIQKFDREREMDPPATKQQFDKLLKPLSQMDIPQHISEAEQLRKRLNDILKVMREIRKFDREREMKLPAIKRKMDKYSLLLSQSPLEDQLRESLQQWAEQYHQTLLAAEANLERGFGQELEHAIQQAGMMLTGHYPDLQAGLFTLSLNFPKALVSIWYGPRKYRLDQNVRLSVPKIMDRLKQHRQNLGSKLPPETLITHLRAAYEQIVQGAWGKEAPIGEVMIEVAYMLQSEKFRQDPSSTNYRSYSRADFSYDLFRLRQTPDKPTLVVATSNYTKRKQDNLWVADDEHGTGTTYSHLLFANPTQ